MKKQANYEHILTVAEELTQTRGYNAFSYRDIAELVGIKTASIHYYFPTKADLGIAVVKKHLDSLGEAVRPLIDDKKLTAQEKLGLFIDGIVAKTYLDNKRMCLGGILASDVLTLPEAIQKEVQHFFMRIEGWLKQLLTEGIERNEFKCDKKELQKETRFILSLFEGSLLLARLFQDDEYLVAARSTIMARLTQE